MNTVPPTISYVEVIRKIGTTTTNILIEGEIVEVSKLSVKSELLRPCQYEATIASQKVEVIRKIGTTTTMA